ncbi:NAD(P)-binding protein [Lentithecium fluviatile CBS 122367]|uniref:NAD(P)-binding protein n=1 Tax=Lentithecium fluviatile CBS 122367 TaxID=1168545 RepID=A0A6G1IJ10_9PLEO|nr:NAD(P)-binding protein [Lentithecium fluviatile CBS 122367]
MQPPFPSPVPTWHNDTYPAIDPAKPELSHEGRTVVITGAGSGIGRATALAYARASASHIALLGRTETTLQETASLISATAEPKTKPKVSVFPCSVTDDAAIRNVAKEVGSWDVLVLNAAYLSTPVKVADVDVDEFWKAFETNVKALVIASQAFLPLARPGAAVLTVGAAGCIFPPAWAGLASYMSSKVAQAKLVEYLAAENPEVLFVSVHPGVVDTGMLRRAELTSLPNDAVELPAHFLVWVSAAGAKGGQKNWLGGRFVWCNWGVGELVERREEIRRSDLFTIGLAGWPFEKSGWNVKDGVEGL